LTAAFNYSQINRNPSLQPSFAYLRASCPNAAGNQNSTVKPELIAIEDDLPSVHVTDKRRFDELGN
jgi:hypothetical protein